MYTNSGNNLPANNGKLFTEEYVCLLQPAEKVNDNIHQ